MNDLFLKIYLNYDHKNYVTFKYTCSFPRKIMSHLTCVLIYSLTKYVIEDFLKKTFRKLCNICRKKSAMMFNVKEITAYSRNCLNKVLDQTNLFGIYEIFNINNSSNLDY